jgi:hypothetical protein
MEEDSAVRISLTFVFQPDCLSTPFMVLSILPLFKLLASE